MRYTVTIETQVPTLDITLMVNSLTDEIRKEDPEAVVTFANDLASVTIDPKGPWAQQ